MVDEPIHDRWRRKGRTTDVWEVAGPLHFERGWVLRRQGTEEFRPVTERELFEFFEPLIGRGRDRSRPAVG